MDFFFFLYFSFLKESEVRWYTDCAVVVANLFKINAVE